MAEKQKPRSPAESYQDFVQSQFQDLLQGSARLLSLGRSLGIIGFVFEEWRPHQNDSAFRQAGIKRVGSEVGILARRKRYSEDPGRIGLGEAVDTREQREEQLMRMAALRSLGIGGRDGEVELRLSAMTEEVNRLLINFHPRF